jgi:hypothetical protein
MSNDVKRQIVAGILQAPLSLFVAANVRTRTSRGHLLIFDTLSDVSAVKQSLLVIERMT